MNSKDFTEKLKNLKIQENQDINILLLGETGVGKSTFINAIANYLHLKNFKTAEKQDLLAIIPTSFHVTDENNEEKLISVGSANDNEYQEVGAAGTQGVKTYIFPIGEGKIRLRLIDSPGVGDPRGVEQDNINCENILAHLGQLKELHAICFLMKPTNSRITVSFEYCLKEILSRLEKSASNNLIFIFTNTRGTNYGPGDTLPCLKKLIKDIKDRPPHVDIPAKDNIFCFDNESFRFLAAEKQKIKILDSDRQNYVDSWNRASKECWRLITYIIGDNSNDGLKPHRMRDTISINEARRLISRLSQPLVDISQLIIDNLHVLNRQKTILKMENQSLDDLKKNLYIPVINLNSIKLAQPVTVCASSKCAQIYKVGERKKWHYVQRCHDPCHLNNIPKDLIGDPGLKSCGAMKESTCTQCSCDFSVHMHVYYMTNTFDDKIIDETVNKNINDGKEALLEVEKIIKDIDVKIKELEEERDIIIKNMGQFAHFLQSNAITPINDSYKKYIEHHIELRKGLGGAADQEMINGLEYMLKQHEEIKGTFEKSLMGWFKQFGSKQVVVDAPSIIAAIKDLYHLKHNGKKIEELMKTQKTSREKEYESNCVEYIHPKVTTGPSSDQNKKDKFKKKNKDTEGNEKQTTKKSTPPTNDYKKKNYPNQKIGHQNRYFYNSETRNDDSTVLQSLTDNFKTLPTTPPPPYSSICQPVSFRGSNDQSRYQSNNSSDQNNMVTKDERKKRSGNRSDDSSNRNYCENESQAPYGHPGGNHHPYEDPSQNYGPPIPPPYDNGYYNGPSTGQYNPLPYYRGSSGPYYESPSGPYPGPSFGNYHAPSGPYHGPSGPYHGPSGPYHGPSGPYHGPSGPYHGPSGSHHGPSGPYHGPFDPHHGPSASYRGPPSGPYYDPSGSHRGPHFGPYRRSHLDRSDSSYGSQFRQHIGPPAGPRGPSTGNYNPRPSRPYNKFPPANRGKGKYQNRWKNGPPAPRRPDPKSNQKHEDTTKKKHESDDSSSD